MFSFGDIVMTSWTCLLVQGEACPEEEGASLQAPPFLREQPTGGLAMGKKQWRVSLVESPSPEMKPQISVCLFVPSQLLPFEARPLLLCADAAVMLIVVDFRQERNRAKTCSLLFVIHAET